MRTEAEYTINNRSFPFVVILIQRLERAIDSFWKSGNSTAKKYQSKLIATFIEFAPTIANAFPEMPKQSSRPDGLLSPAALHRRPVT